MNDFKPNRVACEGWWEQEFLGRQPMHNLSLRFQGAAISGSGIDIIGAFTLSGTIGAGGQIVMVKQYRGQHAVDYLGAYDGEGLLFGKWRIGPLHNRWLIKIKRPASAESFDRDVVAIE